MYYDDTEIDDDTEYSIYVVIKCDDDETDQPNGWFSFMLSIIGMTFAISNRYAISKTLKPLSKICYFHFDKK